MAIVAVAAVVIAAVAVLLITQVLGGSDQAPPQKPNIVEPATTPDTGGQSTTTAPNRSGTQVAVLNGTTVTGLARAAADKLQAGGYRDIGPVTTDTSNQARGATVVFFEPGARREAQDVARLIGIDRTALQQMDQNARALGGNAPVVVIVGADQAQ
ncbi:MAG: LytR C-terminal domain-containing protein [Solirubrobacteraceae bacterium]|nr:LytR C-terminal domain-containing protein [Solirubrobacteraceae bacterium]